MVGPYTPIGQVLGWLHQDATNTFLALVIAQVYEAAPYYVLGAQAAFAGVDTRLEQQAGLLGDRPFRVFRRVTLPLAAPGLSMALATAWARAMGAFGAVVIIAYHPFGIPLQIFTTLQETGLPTALPYAPRAARRRAAAAAPPTSGALVLNADVEVDRRDFTVRATLAVADGERVALFGPSGAGKTTVLEAVAGLVGLRRGVVELGGRVLTAAGAGAGQVAVPPWRRRVGLLRQDPGLFPHLSVQANLTYAKSAAPDAAELAAIAAQLGIEGLLPAMPARLSGGQQHRVALGRLLLAHCDALLLDEPFASLDAALRRTLTALVKDLAAQRSVPALLVTHQLSDAQAFADRLAVMDQGEVLQVAAPDELVLAPASGASPNSSATWASSPPRGQAWSPASIPTASPLAPTRRAGSS